MLLFNRRLRNDFQRAFGTGRTNPGLSAPTCTLTLSVIASYALRSSIQCRGLACQGWRALGEGTSSAGDCSDVRTHLHIRSHYRSRAQTSNLHLTQEAHCDEPGAICQVRPFGLSLYILAIDHAVHFDFLACVKRTCYRRVGPGSLSYPQTVNRSCENCGTPLPIVAKASIQELSSALVVSSFQLSRQKLRACGTQKRGGIYKLIRAYPRSRENERHKKCHRFCDDASSTCKTLVCRLRVHVRTLLFFLFC